MNVAIIGAGMMGYTHADVYKMMEASVCLRYIVDKNEERGKAFAKKYGCEAVDNIGAMVHGEVELIDVCLPTFAHVQTVIEAFECCDNVMVEKPACLTKKDWLVLKKIVQGNQRRLMIGQVLRYWNGYIKAKELLDSGEIGKLQYISCTRKQKMPTWSSDNWLFQAEKSGGILFDLSIHDVDYVAWVLGKPKNVSCQITKNEEKATLFSSILMDYETCNANVVGAWGMPEGFNGGQLSAKLEMVGSRGMISYEVGGCLTLIQDERVSTVALEPTNGYEQEIRYFVDCIQKQEQPKRADVLAVENTMNILWAAQASSEEHRTVSMAGC